MRKLSQFAIGDVGNRNLAPMNVVSSTESSIDVNNGGHVMNHGGNEVKAGDPTAQVDGLKDRKTANEEAINESLQKLTAIEKILRSRLIKVHAELKTLKTDPDFKEFPEIQSRITVLN